jgi:hypothetical protein
LFLFIQYWLFELSGMWKTLLCLRTELWLVSDCRRAPYFSNLKLLTLVYQFVFEIEPRFNKQCEILKIDNRRVSFSLSPYFWSTFPVVAVKSCFFHFPMSFWWACDQFACVHLLYNDSLRLMAIVIKEVF